MKRFLLVATLAALSGCEPVDFNNRSSLSDRMEAISILRANAEAVNRGDIDAMEKTLLEGTPESEDTMLHAQEMLNRYAPRVGVSEVAVISQRTAEIVLEYVQSIQVTKGSLAVNAARVRTTLRKTPSGWRISANEILSVTR